MNSEIPPIPESDNTNFEPIESLDEQSSDGLPIEETSDAMKDIWSGENQTESNSPTQQAEWKPVELDFSQTTTTSTPISLENSNVSYHQAEDIEDSDNEESPSEPELFVDTWLDEADTATPGDESETSAIKTDIEDLKQQKADLLESVAALKAEQEQLRSQQMQVVQSSLVQMLEEGTKELRERKTALRIEIEKLERRQERINQEMRNNFAGSSKELAIRVQGFKEYLVGSLQGLATAAEKLELTKTESPAPRSRERIRSQEAPRREGNRDRERNRNRERSRRSSEPGRDTGRDRNNAGRPSATQFSESTFADQSRRIRQLLDQYCNSPDYYGSPWQLRRTFEANQAKKVQEWFFGQGGRGTVDSTGSRLQNILVASAAISILHSLYSDRCRVLVLTDTPENLGEWRKGLQDCLGISRSNFGANRGVTLFDSPDVLVQRAERLLADKLLPIIIVDETEELLNLSVLKFPLWMAFASTNRSASSNYLY